MEESRSDTAKAVCKQGINDRNITRGGEYDLCSDCKKVHELNTLKSTLISELADAKLSIESYMKDYEKERNMRKTLEERCKQLEKKLADSGTEVVNLSRETANMFKKFDKERTIMNDMKRQEGVLQRKLDHAELVFKINYNRVDDLQQRIVAFLRKNGDSHVTDAVSTTEVSLEAVDAANVICEGDLISMAPPRVKVQHFK